MYIVYKDNNRKHSAWNTRAGAIKQVEVLKDYGFRYSYYEYFNATMHYENGHYFV